ncbi:response regulator [Chloroflexota bacterium]
MSRKILVIDDDPVATRLIEYTLKQRGYQVLTAQNGVEGLKKAQNEEPDLIVLNVMLPGMDGFEVCHRLRAEDTTAQLPILILSGRAQQIDRATGFKMGADDYLTKPATPSEIINRIETLLSRRTVVTSRIIAFLSPRRKVGTTTAVVNIAIALSQIGKRVIAVDLCSEGDSISQQLGVRSQDSIRLLEAPIDTVKHDELESLLAIHETGVRVLCIPETLGKAGNISTSNIDLLFNKLGEVTDYFLVDLPFQPTAIARTVLTQCDLAIAITDHTLEAISEIKSIITTLRFLGIPQERLGVVVTDTNGTFPELESTKIKPYVEANLGIILLGTLPCDTETSAKSSSTNRTPVIISSPECYLARSLSELAKQIVNQEQPNKHSSRTGAIET